MFTGIVEELGEVVTVEDVGDSARVRIRGPLVTSDAGHGDSIAVNGVCLTVTDLVDGTFTADVMKETLDRSSLGALEPGSPVNLERPVTLQARLGGHLVQGHVDGTGTVLERTPGEQWEVVRIATARGAGPVRRPEGLHHRRRGLAHRRRGRPGLVHRQPHPDDPRRDHARDVRPGRDRQPRGRHRRQVRRKAVGRPLMTTRPARSRAGRTSRPGRARHRGDGGRPAGRRRR